MTQKREGKPKCLSKARAASLRSSGGKKAIANAVKEKEKMILIRIEEEKQRT